MSFLSSISCKPSKDRGCRADGFSIGLKYGEGDVQRHILSLHGRDFADSWRICGDFLCVSIHPNQIPPTEWNILDNKVASYAEMARRGSLPPPVVLDFDGSFIDGGHRHAAALEAGIPAIIALVQIENKRESFIEDYD